MTALVRWALRKAWHRGVREGSRPWLVAGGVALLIRLFQRAVAKEESVVYREELRPGESLVIAHEPPS